MPPVAIRSVTPWAQQFVCLHREPRSEIAALHPRPRVRVGACSGVPACWRATSLPLPGHVVHMLERATSLPLPGHVVHMLWTRGAHA